ncbi:Tagatose 1,6-diphosphate aldolase [Paraliobacillus sp. PM-2]|uniref:tagatose 1,6-diphosphate aldolase n=1 Tax=Paraliobacillus sp. PM-2 TaxID=1462524 RepID=UPI00061CC2EF|nr:tagatose 1,6-diphosphate aldolase [Paraliobacillus sp. PM-2]CQR45940.1 Tagatose 1,6-diphosphate aldolase [Paraliobacillus sp. PM-2]
MNLTPGKKKGLEAISNENNIVLATAMDQRGSLGKMITSYNGAISYEEGLSGFKEGISEVLGNKSSSLLLDPEYGWPAAAKLNKDVGLIMAYEKTGYDATEKGRLPNLVDFYSIRDLVEKGAHAVKLLVYYDTAEEEKYNDIKKTFIKRVGDECRQNDLYFILEPVSYDASGLDAKGVDFAKRKPEIIEYFMEEFSKDVYGIDLLKVEVPVSIYHIEGNDQYDNYAPVFSKEDAAGFYRTCSEKSELPFIYLSGGVTNDQFVDTLYFAKEAGSTFNGCLCGRAIWKDGVKTFAVDGKKAFQDWLETTGTENLNKVIKAVNETATPWDADTTK